MHCVRKPHRDTHFLPFFLICEIGDVTLLHWKIQNYHVTELSKNQTIDYVVVLILVSCLLNPGESELIYGNEPFWQGSSSEGKLYECQRHRIADIQDMGNFYFEHEIAFLAVGKD